MFNQVGSISVTLLGAIGLVGQVVVSHESAVTVGLLLAIVAGVAWAAGTATGLKKDTQANRKEIDRVDHKVDNVCKRVSTLESSAKR